MITCIYVGLCLAAGRYFETTLKPSIDSSLASWLIRILTCTAIYTCVFN